MGSFFFIIKCAILTFILVMIMQVQVNNRTLEQHAVRFINGSNIMEPLQQTAKATAKAARKKVRKIWVEAKEHAADQVDQAADEITE